MTIDPNVLVALCTLALALTAAIMVYFSAKSVTITGILARISTLKLLSEEQKEIMEKLKDKYGPLDKSNPSWEKIKSNPKDVEDVQRLYVLEAAISSLREEMIQQMVPHRKFKGKYEQLVKILGESKNTQILSTDKKEK